MPSRLHLRGRVQDRILEALVAKSGLSTKAEISAAVLIHPQMVRLGIRQSDITAFAKDLATRCHIIVANDTWTITESGRALYLFTTKSRK